MAEQRYQWGTREVWSDGYTSDQMHSGEGDARDRIRYYRRGKQFGQMSNLMDLCLIRRPVGEWEEVSD